MHADHAAGWPVCFVSILCSSYWKTVPFLHAAFFGSTQAARRQLLEGGRAAIHGAVV